MNEELKAIKKIYGEEMMHLCRELFPSILEKEGLLLSILKSHLAPTHSFVADIEEYKLYDEFKRWIYSFIDVEEEHQIITSKTPFELMDEAGYILYECKSEEDIQKFRKYYAIGEELCTFRGGRLDRCYVFFAVKKNVDEIKRENFTNPKRQDEYGTSIISIQFTKSEISSLSIKNRYNHTVNNPDATFSNNLENIIPGLTNSFEKYLCSQISKQGTNQEEFLTYWLCYVKGNDKKYYRYNLEIDGIYYCENNIIVKDVEVITKYADNPERYIFIEQYLIDLKDKSIKLFESDQDDDAFVKSIYDVGKIEKIVVTKNVNNKIITINYEEGKEVKIEINKNNAIVGYDNNYVQEIGDNFLCLNKQINSISLSNVQTIGNDFLCDNAKLNNMSLPNVKIIGNNFLYCNDQLSSISLPQVQTIGNGFLYCNNEQLSSISLPQVQIIESDFLNCNEQLSSISLPKVQKIGDNFLIYNEALRSISLPNVKTIGNYFLYYNDQLSSISLPNVKTIGNGFLGFNDGICSISLPQVQTIGDNFLYYNEQLNTISLPNVQKIGFSFLFSNNERWRISEEINNQNNK